METEKHLSDSSVQQDIETLALESLKNKEGINTFVKPFTFHLSGYRFDVDGVIGVSEIDGKYHFEKDIHLFEVYAGIEKLLSGQKRKIQADVLKLITVEQHIKKLNSSIKFHKYIVLIDDSLKTKVTGQNWFASTLELFDFKVITVELETDQLDLLKSIKAAQAEGMKKGKRRSKIS